ncbi:serine hydrolase family protein [Burkholderia stagnalis]|uniref:RBBP9/YdeN family alpha/beta hydrolase n=1 Tax=Burkholderia stagnalis TaxID=1503054 RepID=UPI000F5879DF|nr:alpha/beta hydrolase [Burkholderia stagnalis]RQQ12279.1 serine hydrolase family protein [Burkholderia stagnalis]RQQ14510.1 serine hydrolase family protein [Burkholderia stagnalis]RQQ32443.1 serine hydrolase family protein [Burkholderia stagnalis]RQQ32690.1 serine hydrolase family protein [Burkholderia stagnalis]RQQ40876.1 serine hydrolase family protein [Burkholderia stagnalis]
MTLAKTPTILIVPGLRDHVEDHWQTHLERRLPNARSVAPLERDKLSRAARVAALDAALAAIDGPVILVAHSAGVMITVHWARQATRAIQGALLATPADLDEPMPDGYPTMEALDAHGWTPVPTQRLPFPSLVAASRNDPLARFERVEALAAGWGSRFVDLGEVGHLNPASGYGEWPGAAALIAELLAPGGH